MTRGRIAGGPFKGMEFVPHAVWGSSAPMLAGTYEAEIEAAIENLIARRPSRVLDIGAAEGYYAVGLALRLPEATVYAYDIDPDARRLCTEVAARNGVGERVAVQGFCSHSDLRRLAGYGCIMVVDCEGCEAQLLDPVRVPELASTAMLVELHDFIDHTISSRLVERFSQSHRVELFDATTRNGTQVTALASMKRRNRHDAVDERRPREPYAMQWLLLTPLDDDAMGEMPAGPVDGSGT